MNKSHSIPRWRSSRAAAFAWAPAHGQQTDGPQTLPRTLAETAPCCARPLRTQKLVRRAEAQTTRLPRRKVILLRLRDICSSAGRGRGDWAVMKTRGVTGASSPVGCPKALVKRFYGLLMLRDVQAAWDLSGTDATHARLIATAPADSGAMVYVHANR